MNRPDNPGHRAPTDLPLEGSAKKSAPGGAADLELAPRPSLPNPPPAAPAAPGPQTPDSKKVTQRPVKRPGSPPARRSRGGANTWLAAVVALAVGGLAAWFLKPDPAVVVLSSPLLDFGEVRLATASDGLRLEITNVGERALLLSRVFLDGEKPEEFALSADECAGKELAAKTSCAVVVTFNPSDTGPRRARLHLEGESLYALPQLPLLGLGVAPQLEAEPLKLDFGEQLVGSRSSRTRVRVANRGSAPLAIERAELEGAGAGDFKATDQCSGVTLAPGERCTLEYRFLPTSSGERRAVLRLMSDGADALAASPELVGRGLPRQAALRIEPRSFEFEPQAAGTPSPPKKLKLTNAGTARLSLRQLEITSGVDGSTPFRLGTGCSGKNLEPGRSCTVDVVFEPAAEGEFSADVNIRHDAGGARRVPLSGTGTVPEIFLDPLVLDFGQVRTGSVSDSKFLKVVNSGSGPLTISAIRLRGPGAQAFTARPVGCTTAPIKPKSSCGVEVRFKPNRGGAIEAEIHLSHNAGDGTSRVEVRGLGRVP